MPKSKDGSVYDRNGRLLFCSADRFVANVCEGQHCFICDRTEHEVNFNQEHILPNWLLKQFSLHRGSVSLPNLKLHGYGTYKIPCCFECNDRLSKHFEIPISVAFAGGLAGVQELVEREGPERLFQWMALIFLKMHLKDRRLRKHLDRRLVDVPISETYDWLTFHHLHCLIRAHYTCAAVGDYVLGSILLVEVDPDGGDGLFDLASITDAFTLFMRAGDIALYVTFNDAQACVGAIDHLLKGITGMLNPPQARELAVELAAANLHLTNRPTFMTLMSDADGTDLEIVAQVSPEGPIFQDMDRDTVGFVKHFILKGVAGNVKGHTREEVTKLLRQNKISFLFDNEGKFVKTGRQSEEYPSIDMWSQRSDAK